MNLTEEKDRPQISAAWRNPKSQSRNPQGEAATPGEKSSSFKTYLEGIGAKKKGLELALREQGVKSSLYEFVRNMIMISLVLGIAIGATLIILFMHIGLGLPQAIILGVLLGVVVGFMAFQTFLNFQHTGASPTQRL